MRVFVSIASYCDPILGFTLARAVATARWPDQLHFGIVDQSPAAAPGPVPADVSPARLSYMRIEPIYARGPCWARAIAMSLYDGEDWFFQIDSHMDFDPNWDERLIAQSLRLLPGRKGFAVSAYPHPILFHVVKPGASFEPDHPVLGFEAHPLDSDQAQPGYHLGAGCLFAPGKFVQAFPYDPWFYFHGEEQALAVRLFTHGWDVFHMPGLPVYHLYNNADSGAPPRPLHWDESHDAQRAQTWWALEQRSRNRLKALVAGESLGVYSLGKERTLADFAAFSGIDYRTRTIEARAYRAPAPPAQG